MNNDVLILDDEGNLLIKNDKAFKMPTGSSGESGYSPITILNIVEDEQLNYIFDSGYYLYTMYDSITSTTLVYLMKVINNTHSVEQNISKFGVSEPKYIKRHYSKELDRWTVTEKTILTDDFIVDDLTSEDKNKILSAKQGFELNKKIEQLKETNNNLETCSIKNLGTFENESFLDEVMSPGHYIYNLYSASSDTTYVNLMEVEESPYYVRQTTFVYGSEPAKLSKREYSKALKRWSGSDDKFLTFSQVQNTLTSTSTQLPLSANQGRVLNEKFTNDISILENKINSIAQGVKRIIISSWNSLNEVKTTGLYTFTYNYDVYLMEVFSNYQIIYAFNQTEYKLIVRMYLTNNATGKDDWMETSYDFSFKNDIVDNLTSNESTKPLSANQGRILYELIKQNTNLTPKYHHNVEVEITIGTSGYLSAYLFFDYIDERANSIPESEKGFMWYLPSNSIKATGYVRTQGDLYNCIAIKRQSASDLDILCLDTVNKNDYLVSLTNDMSNLNGITYVKATVRDTVTPI